MGTKESHRKTANTSLGNQRNVRPGTLVTLLSEDMGDTFRRRVLRSGLIIGGIVEPVGMWKSLGRFPRTGGRVEILPLDFQAFLRPSFPRAVRAPAGVAAQRARRDERCAPWSPEIPAAPVRTALRNSARRAPAVPTIRRRKSR